MTQNMETTIEVTVGEGSTISEYSTYVVTQGGTAYTTKSLVPVTTVIPSTETTTPGSAPSSSSPVTAGGNAKNGPAAALLAGIIGLVALV